MCIVSSCKLESIILKLLDPTAEKKMQMYEHVHFKPIQNLLNN